ncbi:hypothetical protein D7V86_25445 [bacterium D16-51]|nr:hypothetical protein D7V96_26045 [bacterium D16-59]RKI53037.1 hypothetical protein D7V86_25445 [bacterium D16-51]
MKLRAERLAREGKNSKKPNQEILSNHIKDYNNAVQKQYKLEKVLQMKLTEAKLKLQDIKAKKALLSKEKNSLLSELAKLQKLANEELSEEERAKESLELIAKLNESALDIIESLEKELASCSVFETEKKKRLVRQIASEKQKIADRNSYQSSFVTKARENSSLQKYKKLQEKSNIIQSELDTLESEYQSTLISIPQELQKGLTPDKGSKTKEELLHSK